MTAPDDHAANAEGLLGINRLVRLLDGGRSGGCRCVRRGGGGGAGCRSRSRNLRRRRCLLGRPVGRLVGGLMGRNRILRHNGRLVGDGGFVGVQLLGLQYLAEHLARIARSGGLNVAKGASGARHRREIPARARGLRGP